MKQILLFISFFLTISSIAQKSEVINDSLDHKSSIFSKSLLWIAKTWKSSNDVVQMKDEASGTIVVKGALKTVPTALGIGGKGHPYTQITILVKDGKAKISFEDTFYRWDTGKIWNTNEKPSMSGKQYDRWKNGILSEIDALIISYRAALNEKTEDF